jgi:RNA 2',3'-cyclic 3'-phosphodiesterase
VRLFAALPLPSSAAAGLAAAVQELRSSREDLRWVNAAGYHVTLYFFGDVAAAALDALRAAFGDRCLRGSSFPAALGAIGQFPDHGAPRVVWASLAEGQERARMCWQLVQSVIAPLGWTPDPRGFTPHVTLARAGRGAVRALDRTPPLPAQPFSFQEIVLFESVLGSGGAVYKPQVRVPLDGAAS